MHKPAPPSAALLIELAAFALAASLTACGASQSTPETAAQSGDPAAPVAEERKDPPPAAPCIAESLARYQREPALSCLLEVDHPHRDLVDMKLGEATRARATERFGALGAEALAPLLTTIDETMGDEVLSAKLVAALSAAVTDAQIQAMLEYAATSLGRRERMLMESEPDEGGMTAWSEQVELSEARSKLLAEYCAATGVSSVGQIIVVTPALSMTTAMTAAMQPENADKLDQLEATIREQVAPVVVAFEDGACSMLAFATRSLSDAELEQANAFYRTPEAAGYIRQELDAFNQVFAEAYAAVGTAMAPLAKQAAEVQ